MQDKSNMKKTIGHVIKILVPIVCLTILYDQISKSDVLDCSLTAFIEGEQSTTFLLYVGLVFLLMPVNWILESYKWFLLINKVEHISLVMSIKATLSGLSISILFPFRIGEYLGRISYISKKEMGVILTIFGSMTQLIATLIFGYLSLYLIDQTVFSEDNVQWIAIIIIVLILFIIIGLKIFPIWLKSILKWDKAKKSISKIIEVTTIPFLVKIQVISVVRYMVFTIQYILMFYAFNFQLNFFYLFTAVSIMYLATTIVPVNQIVELGSSKSLILISLLSSVADLDQNLTCYIAIIGFGIWLINIVLPSLIGLVFLTLRKKSLID